MSSVKPADVPIVFDADRILAELDSAHNRLPEEAIVQTRRHRDIMIPRLIGALRDATATMRAGKTPEGNAAFFALFLLAELQAREALPAILEAISLPGDGAHKYFGDAITESLARVLISLAEDPLPLFDELIANRQLHDGTRWAAADGYMYLVRDGVITREVAIERLALHLQRAIDGKDTEIADCLVITLVSFSPREVNDLILNAFDLHLVDELMIERSEVEESIASGPEEEQKHWYLDENTRIDDTIDELRHWACFDQHADVGRTASELSADDVFFQEDDEIDELVEQLLESNLPETNETFVVERTKLESRRVGRNDPCPCGSGKKYKKCCGAK